MSEEVIPGVHARHNQYPVAEVMPGQDANLPAPAMLAPEVLAKTLQRIDEAIKSSLKDGTDYGIIPGTNKPTLLKPGAEKLAGLFGLSARLTLADKIEDHFREWDYEKWDKGTKSLVTHKARGFYFYRYQCEMVSRGTGAVAARFDGSCTSTERGKEAMPANSIAKMAQKRAMVGAVLTATFSSDRFTQDMEDQADTPHVPGSAPATPAKPGAEVGRVIRRMPSTKANGFCHFCKKPHIQVGEQIVGVEELPGEEKARWGSGECYGSWKLSQEQTAATPPPPPNDSEPPPEAAPVPSGSEAEEIRRLELELYPGEIAERMAELRQAYAGKKDLAEAAPTALRNYLEFLRKQKTAL